MGKTADTPKAPVRRSARTRARRASPSEAYRGSASPPPATKPAAKRVAKRVTKPAATKVVKRKAVKKGGKKAAPSAAPATDGSALNPIQVSDALPPIQPAADAAPPPPAPVEKRLKRFRARCPVHLEERMERCRTQRMYVLDRQRDPAKPLEETFEMAGSTGNVYEVTICEVPRCNCPDGIKNGTCKHILYIMIKVLQADAHLVYQAALLPSELTHIFARAPAPAIKSIDAIRQDAAGATRKPLEDDDCPICYCGFDAGEATVYCVAQCGTNVHAACFRQWAATRAGAAVTCVMCRQPWKDPPGAAAGGSGSAARGGEGYRNVGAELALPATRGGCRGELWRRREADV
ncbi:hypothetical protein EDC01DRAFT_617043 [Geopyxis carbonaria]|nr:hypothetical protein EDC01DRAFT_617043 [Geopyxis carbonaria]